MENFQNKFVVSVLAWSLPSVLVAVSAPSPNSFRPVDTRFPLWQATVRKVLIKASGIRSFVLDDYGVQVLGKVDPQRLLKKLAEAGIYGTLCFGTFGSARDYVVCPEHDHLCDSCGTGWSVCDYDWCCCCGNGGYPPGPFAKLAREVRHRPPPPPAPRQTFHYVQRSVGCFNLM